jgi:hypothetical protein
MGQHSAIGSQSDLEKSTPSDDSSDESMEAVWRHWLAMTKPHTWDDSSTGTKPTQFSTIEEISQRVKDTLTPDGRVDDVQQTLSAVTSQFGKEECAPVHLFSPEFYDISGHPPITFESMAGVYIFFKDIIGLRTEVPDKPISEYDVRDVRAFKTAVHEALHSARKVPDELPGPRMPRWRFHDHVLNHPMGARLDEGMTEYLAREITSTTLSDAPGMARIDWENTHGSYPRETKAVRFMIEYGNFDVVAAYQNYSHTTDEDGRPEKWKYLEQAHEANDNAIIEILTRAGYTEEELQESEIITLLGEARKLNIFPLMFYEVMSWLSYLVDENFRKPYDDRYAPVGESKYIDRLAKKILYAIDLALGKRTGEYERTSAGIIRPNKTFEL